MSDSPGDGALQGQLCSAASPRAGRAGLETILDDLLEEVPQGAGERLPEDLLRRIFARLPQSVP
jgi:hypothetical protein